MQADSSTAAKRLQTTRGTIPNSARLLDGVDGRFVPNLEEQTALEHMQAMRMAGDSYRTVGAAFGKPAMTVKCILDRSSAQV